MTNGLWHVGCLMLTKREAVRLFKTQIAQKNAERRECFQSA